MAICMFFCYWISNLFIKRQTLCTLNYAFVGVYSIGLFTPVNPLLVLLQRLLISFLCQEASFYSRLNEVTTFPNFIQSQYIRATHWAVVQLWISCMNSLVPCPLYVLGHSVGEVPTFPSQQCWEVLSSPFCSANGHIPKMSLVMMKAVAVLILNLTCPVYGVIQALSIMYPQM